MARRIRANRIPRASAARAARAAARCSGCADGKLSAHVHAVYPLEKIADALKALADRKAMGKILLRP